MQRGRKVPWDCAVFRIFAAVLTDAEVHRAYSPLLLVDKDGGTGTRLRSVRTLRMVLYLRRRSVWRICCRSYAGFVHFFCFGKIWLELRGGGARESSGYVRDWLCRVSGYQSAKLNRAGKRNFTLFVLLPKTRMKKHEPKHFIDNIERFSNLEIFYTSTVS